MAREIRIEASAEKDKRQSPRDVWEQLSSTILELREDPRPSGVLKPKGKSDEGWRFRVGDYRVVYQIDDGARQVTVYRVRHRRDVYRF